MNFHDKFKQLIIIIFCLFSSFVYALEEKDSVLLSKEIQKSLDKNRKKYHLPAISLSLQLPNNSTQNFVSGYYYLSQQRKITSDSLFQMGSITKTFTATIVLKLIEENKLTLSDSLQKWLPQYARWKNISIYDLLHHTSGIYNYTDGKSFDDLLRKNPKKYWSLNELAAIAYKHPDIFKAGKKYHYTNTEYILLGMIIEKVTNKPIQQVFDDYFTQYELHNTFYPAAQYSDAIKTRIVHGYNQDGTFRFNTDVTSYNISFTQSAGSMISTPGDIVKWLNALFTGKIITKKSIADMTKIISEEDGKNIDINTISKPIVSNKSMPFVEIGAGAGIGLVYFKNNGLTWIHAGGTPGYESLYTYSPCNGIYLALSYNVKPKKQLIFIRIADEVFKIINRSAYGKEMISKYQQNIILPEFCDKLT